MEVAKLVEKKRLGLSIPVEEWLEKASTYPGIKVWNHFIHHHRPQLSYYIFVLRLRAGTNYYFRVPSNQWW